MSVEDFRINAFVRQVLSRSWIDLNSIRFGSVGRIVYFHGRFEKVRSADTKSREMWERTKPEELAGDLTLLETVEREIRREPTVADVVFRFDNFRKIKGQWVPTET